MKKRLAVIITLAAITLFFPVWIGGQQARAADINILPYYVAGNVGDFWTYSFISPQEHIRLHGELNSGDFRTLGRQISLGKLYRYYRFSPRTILYF